MEEEFLKIFLENAVEDSKKEIQEKGTLSQTNAISLLMKIMFNHVTDLTKEIVDIRANMATKDDLKDDLNELKGELKGDIKELKNDFRNWLMYGVAIIAVIITLVSYFLR